VDLVLEDEDLSVVFSTAQLLDVVVLLPLERQADLVVVGVEDYNFELPLELREGSHQVNPVDLAQAEAVHAGGRPRDIGHAVVEMQVEGSDYVVG